MEQKRKLKLTLFLGLMSIFLYILLYKFSPLLSNYGQKGGWYFILPIGVAFIFSIVHGAFTGHFWDSVGLKAAKKTG